MFRAIINIIKILKFWFNSGPIQFINFSDFPILKHNSKISSKKKIKFESCSPNSFFKNIKNDETKKKRVKNPRYSKNWKEIFLRIISKIRFSNNTMLNILQIWMEEAKTKICNNEHKKVL